MLLLAPFGRSAAIISQKYNSAVLYSSFERDYILGRELLMGTWRNVLTNELD